MLRKSDVIQRRDAARKQFEEDEDYDKWTETLNQLYEEAVPNEVYFLRDNPYVPMLNKLRHIVYEGHPNEVNAYKADKLVQRGDIPADDDSLWTVHEPFEWTAYAVANPGCMLYSSDDGHMPYVKGKAYPYNNGEEFFNELVARKPKALKYLKGIHDAGYDVSNILEYAQHLSGNDMLDIKTSLGGDVPPHKSNYPDDTIVYRSVYSYPYKMQDKDVQSLKELLSNKDKFAFDDDWDSLLGTSKDNDAINRLKTLAYTNYEDLPLEIRNMYDKYHNGEISADEYNEVAAPYHNIDHILKYNTRDEDTVNDILSKYTSDSIEVAPDGIHALSYNSPHLEDYLPLFLTDADEPDDTQKSINDTLTDRRF